MHISEEVFRVASWRFKLIIMATLGYYNFTVFMLLRLFGFGDGREDRLH